MKKWMLLPLLALAGCTQLQNYQQVVKAPAPAEYQGVWRTMGPQSGLVSPEAQGSLIIQANGDTLDCRQWQRVIAKPGKLAVIDGDLVNVNRQLRVMPLEIKQGKLHYDKLVLEKANAPTEECQRALELAKSHPDQESFQNIEMASQK